MVNTENILDLARYGLIAIFTLGIIHLVGTVMIGGYLYPMINAQAPVNATTGITTESYFHITNHLWWSFKTGLYVVIGGIFVFILFKALFEKESTSVSWG